MSMRLVKFIIFSMVVLHIFLIDTSTSQAQERRIDCSRSDAQYIRDNAYDSLEFLGIRLYSGSIEGKNHYDALVAAYDSAGLKWCRRYEVDTSASSYALDLNEWGGRIFVTLSVNEATGVLEAYAANGWLPSYGLGAGPEVGLILEIEPYINGSVLNGTYVLSHTADGLTNSVIIYGVQYHDTTQQVHIDGIASSYVLDETGAPFDYLECPRGSAFRYILDYDMAQVIEVQCNGVSLRSDAVLQNTGEIAENLPEPINPGGDFFAYCTATGGILVMGTVNGNGYELFMVTNQQIANGLAEAVITQENLKLGEGENVSLWALEDGENLQFSKPDPYAFMFNKYRCGDLAIPNGAPVTVSSSATLPEQAVVLAPRSTPTPSAGAGLPIYRPSPLRLNDDGTYTIRTGDNLATIAAKLGIPADVLAEYNGIANVRLIQVGQVLEIPDGDD